MILPDDKIQRRLEQPWIRRAIGVSGGPILHIYEKATACYPDHQLS